MIRHFYSAPIPSFLRSSSQEIFGALAQNSGFADEVSQKEAWLQQISILKEILKEYNGTIFFEYSIPRMGRRIDVVLIIKNVIFILEFKVGESEFLASALDQVFDYALDLKNFHETSHAHLIAPILIATKANGSLFTIATTPHNDNIIFPLRTNSSNLKELIDAILSFSSGDQIDSDIWSKGRYQPTPTIIEAAMALYSSHSVAEISRSDASAINLTETSNAVSQVIDHAKANNTKAICFVTGVPGAGKTLVGLDIATKHLDKEQGTASVFLSGNGPLVAILREALTRDKVKREKERGIKITKGEAGREVKMFIQNVHNFRDEYMKDESAPFDHVAIFDEAQRAWDHQQTASFMKRKKNFPNFLLSEPEYLISCMDRHQDWAVIVCLVGGGQEINTGEAGISEWIDSLNRSFPHWQVHMSSKLTDSEYAAGNALNKLVHKEKIFVKDEMHLSVSMRSFRAEHLSSLIKNLLDLDLLGAQKNYQLIKEKYPIVITRDLGKAKHWLKEKARGTERYGIIVSSQAQRLKPLAIDVRSPMDPIHWFLDGKGDVRSSYFLEDVATEFHVQGLELDWVCVTWDADFRYAPEGWKTHSFVGDKWHNIVKEERKLYLKNAYRVLLTRARQGMVIVVPEGDENDPTRNIEYYNPSFDYLREIGLPELKS
jgi:hypothetical protein